MRVLNLLLFLITYVRTNRDKYADLFPRALREL